ncbi:hypothetical protein, partial [uncultured Methanofollis sp.]|uniref:hypothetical protein n=1 Tax=uncultured Methanofollis sp. TaxID=262500 RepID=UPI0026158339
MKDSGKNPHVTYSPDATVPSGHSRTPHLLRQEKMTCRRRLALYNERIASRRLNFAHQTSRQLVDRFGTIVFEDLNIQKMQKCGRDTTRQAPRADNAPRRVVMP